MFDQITTASTFLNQHTSISVGRTCHTPIGRPDDEPTRSYFQRNQSVCMFRKTVVFYTVQTRNYTIGFSSIWVYT